MKTLFRTYKLVMVLLFPIVSINAQKPEIHFIENPDYKAAVADSKESVKGGDHFLGVMPSPYKYSVELPAYLKEKSFPRVAAPANFDLRSTGGVTSVKNQGSCGSCWTFAAMGSIESQWLVAGKGNYDLSEDNLNTCHPPFVWAPCYGGNAQIATSYLVGGAGPFSETDDPYSDSHSFYDCPAGLTPQGIITSAWYLPNDPEVIKSMLQSYGAMYTSLRWEEYAYNSNDYTYYYSGSDYANHAVTLVGWDDNKITAAGMGAWIVKNSWGDYFGENGFFYVAYQDTRINTEVVLYPSHSNYDADNKVLTYSESGWSGRTTGYWGYYSADVLVKFVAEGNINLTRIGTFATYPGAILNIQVYDSFDGSSSLTGLLGTIPAQTCTFTGYHSFELPNSIPVSNGNDYYIKINYETPGSYYSIPFEQAIYDYCEPQITPGIFWKKLPSDIIWNEDPWENADPCVYVYTAPGMETVATPVFAPQPGIYSTPQSVSINCSTPGATIRYTFDGSTPDEADPVYTGSLTLTGITQLKARAFHDGFNPSEVSSGTYLIGDIPGTVIDSLALVALYNSTNGPGWNNNTNWLTGPLETWYGIFLAGDRRVQRINLSGNNLIGSIPDEIGNLSNLTWLYLNNNNLSGQIPNNIGNLTNLYYLVFSYNQLSGSLPNSIGNLSNLFYLNLTQNHLTGTIPAEIGNLSNIETIMLMDNNFTGLIPPEIGNLTKLTGLALANNQLSGNIPQQIGNLTNLTELALYNNQFSGSIPSELGNLTKLYQLNLAVNQLSGNLPVSLTNLVHLQSLNVSENQLSGELPILIGNITSLRGLSLNGNQFFGSIPVQIGNLSILEYLNLSNNQFNGGIPSELYNLNELRYLELSNNLFSGTISEDIGNLIELRSLNLANNGFTGNIPNEICQLSMLQSLMVQNCQFKNIPDLTSLELLNTTFIWGNDFTFEDIEPNLGIPNFYYVPQNPVGENQHRYVNEGESVRMSVIAGGSHNLYQWYKDGIPLIGEQDSVLYIHKASSEDAGSYNCNISNSIVTDLVLYSNPILVEVNETIHFTPVWQNTSGFDHMNFYTLRATIDGLDMQPGDEIGIFDDDICVGAGVVNGIVSQDNYLEIRVSRDDPATEAIDGYTTGHQASFRIWDDSEQRQLSEPDIIYISGNNTFDVGASTFYEIYGESAVSQVIPLMDGWNIFSLNVIPDNRQMRQIVQSLIDNDALIKIQNEAGAAIEPIPGTDIWIDNIGEWQITEGYKIRVNRTIDFIVEGTPNVDPVNIELSAGWNIFGYPYFTAQNAMSALNSIILSGNLMKVQDEAGSSIEPLPAGMGWIDNIGNLNSGEGYKIRVAEQDVLSLLSPATGPSVLKSAIATPTLPVHFKTIWKGNGYDHMNIYLKLSNNLLPGDEIGIFDGDLCVGSLIIENRENELLSVVVSADDPTTAEIDGFTEGHPVCFKSWKNGIVSDEPEMEFLLGYTDKFEAMGTTMASMKLSGISDENGLLGDCYPNPFRIETTIPFTVTGDNRVIIEIFNILGQRLKTLMNSQLQEGSYKLVWDGTNSLNEKVVPGTYVCKMICGNKAYIKKIDLY